MYFENPTFEFIEILEIWSGLSSIKSVRYYLEKKLRKTNIKSSDGAYIKNCFYIANNYIYFV